MSTIIDIYCHIYPERFSQAMMKAAPNLGNIAQRLRRVSKLFDLDARFKEMDEYGDYRQIISLPNPPIEDIVKPDIGLQLARIANDEMAELCRKHGLSPATFYKLKAKYGGLEVSDARRLRQLEDENGKLKRLLAESVLDNAILKDLLGKV